MKEDSEELKITASETHSTSSELCKDDCEPGSKCEKIERVVISFQDYNSDIGAIVIAVNKLIDQHNYDVENCGV